MPEAGSRGGTARAARLAPQVSLLLVLFVAFVAGGVLMVSTGTAFGWVPPGG